MFGLSSSGHHLHHIFEPFRIYLHETGCVRPAPLTEQGVWRNERTHRSYAIIEGVSWLEGKYTGSKSEYLSLVRT